MARRATLCAVLGLASLLLAGCGGGSNALQIPRLSFTNGGTSAVSPQFAGLEGGIPQGRQAVFIGDVVVLRGGRFRPNLKFFLGINVPEARAPNSIFTTPRHLLPNEPFVHVDESGRRTVLEIEAPVEYTSDTELRVTTPACVAW